MPPRRHRRGGQFAASIVGILNSNSTSDREARNNIVKVYVPLLCIVYIFDLGCALSMLYIQCSGNDADGADGADANHSMTLNQCVAYELQKGFSKRSNNNNNHEEEEDSLGDLFWLALIRCVVTSLLLYVGVKYGKYQSKSDDDNNNDNMPSTSDTCIIINENNNDGATTTTVTAESPQGQLQSQRNGENNGSSQRANDHHESSLTSPLLINNEEESNEQNNVHQNGSRNNSGESFNANPSNNENQANGNASKNQFMKIICSFWKKQSAATTNDGNDTTTSTKWFQFNPITIKNSTLILLFLTSTFFQVYAGIKVSTFNYPSKNDEHTTRFTNINPALPPLMCLTILWINIMSYIFRVLLEELTRQDALYLPPTVHRHPVFYEENRGINLHWCDICRRRIVASSLSSDTIGCYRCSLCDFDICVSCAQREDAATVGENLLRGDRGVRSEQVLDNRSYFSRSWVFVKPQLCLLSMSLLLLTCSSLTKLALPHFQGRIIDKVIPDENGEHDHEGFLRYIRIYVVVMVVQGAVTTMYSAIFTLVSRRLKFTLRNSLFESILSQDVAYFDGTESGRLISRLTNDLDMMMSPIQSSLSSLLNNILILIGGMIMCFIKSYRLSMLAFVTIGPITYLWNLYAQWSKGLAREMLAYWAEGNSTASQALSHVRTVKAFGCEGRVLEKYSATNKEALDRGVKDAWGNGITSALTGYLDLGAGVLILYFGGLLVFQGVMTVGELVTFQLFWNMMNNAYQNLQGLITSFTRSAAGAEKIFSLFDSKPDIDPNEGADINWDVKGDIELKNVKFYYQMRPDNIVLENFNLSIPAGKTIALVGKSGGGKSTIINLLLRFYDAKGGSLLLDGREYASIKVPQLRSLFGVVTQETELFALTVEQNIAYGLNKDEYTMEELISAAKKAQAYEFISAMKDGFQTRIGERGNRLSGGQRQRIAIARVFLRKPRIILLDEATSALDENSQEAVQNALNTLITESKATVVVVAHRLSTVMNADSIVVIEQGVALEQGTHHELVERDGVYASMVQKQKKKETNELKE